jgi:hypothetical protein
MVVRTLEETEGARHWSKREMARRVGISPSSYCGAGRRSGSSHGGPRPSRSPRTRG